MDNDTAIGGPHKGFPATRLTLVEAAASQDPEVRERALESLVGVYWKAVYKHIRLKWRLANEDAKDLTQGFFAQVLEKGWLRAFDPRRARFRTYLRTCLDAFVKNEWKAARRLKRGGGRETLSLDFDGAEGELARLDDGTDVEEAFHKEWVRSLFGLAVAALQRDLAARGKETAFVLFERYDLEGSDPGVRLTYADLAGEFNMSVSQVTNQLAFARGEFRRRVLESLRQVTGSEEEFRSEAADLFGPAVGFGAE